MKDHRESAPGRWAANSADEILGLVQQALAANEARDEAIFEQSAELGPGPVPDGWLSLDHAPDQVRRPLERAEKLLDELVEVDRRDDSIDIRLPAAVGEALRHLGENTLHDAMIERVHRRLNASWSYIDMVSWERLIVFDRTPVLFMLTLPLGKPHKGHAVIGEEHNQSGVHFHYARLDGKRSDILFAFGADAPEPQYPIKWERHGKGKAKFHPKPVDWNLKKRVNVNEVCCSARDTLPAETRYFTPSKGSQFLLPM